MSLELLQKALELSLAISAETFITEYFGERCSTHQEGCPCCEAWGFLDRIKSHRGKNDESTN